MSDTPRYVNAEANAQKLRRIGNKDAQGIPYAYGNRHARRAKVAIKRGEYMRSLRKYAGDYHDLIKEEIKERVERRQFDQQQRALARREATQGQPSLISRARRKIVDAYRARRELRRSRRAAYLRRTTG